MPPKLWKQLVLALGLLAGFSGRVPAAHAQAPAVTFDRVVEYLQLDVSEAKLLQLIDNSPSHFILGADQLAALRAAGATDKLIAAMQKKGALAPARSDVQDFVLILDCSGSMNDKLADGTSKWRSAQRAAMEMIRSIPEGRNLCVIAYGLDATRKCEAIDVLRPLSPLDDEAKAALTRQIERLNAVGHTPIAKSLAAAGRQLAASNAMSSIILLTDGVESCHGDPSAEAARLVAQIPNLRGGINVIGYCLGDADSTSVRQISRAGKGAYYDAKDAQELTASVRKLERELVQAQATEEVDLSELSPVARLLIEQLADPSFEVRRAAASAVAQRKITQAAPALARLILEAEIGRGLNWSYDRDDAIDALAQLAPERLPKVLTAALQAESANLREWAAGEIVDHKVMAALPAVEARLLALTDRDVENRTIRGSAEADALADCLQKLAPDRLAETLVKIIRGPHDENVKVWATVMLRVVQ